MSPMQTKVGSNIDNNSSNIGNNSSSSRSSRNGNSSSRVGPSEEGIAKDLLGVGTNATPSDIRPVSEMSYFLK